LRFQQHETFVKSETALPTAAFDILV